MRKVLLFALTAALLASCNNTPTARIDVTVDGAADSSVVIQQLVLNRFQPVDTVKTDSNGHFAYKIDLKGSAPYFYYLFYGENPIASMALLPKDRVSIKASQNGIYEITGSEESTKLKVVNDKFANAINRMTLLASESLSTEDDARIKEINSELSKLYVNYKRDAVKYIMENPNSISSAIVLFQKFNDNLPVFDDVTDALLFKRVKDSLSVVYPSSEIVMSLRDEVEARERRLQLQNHIDEIVEVSFPDLVMPDENGEIRHLSDFEGNVIILSFWSVDQTAHKVFNTDLKELYDEYHQKGLEIYQVSLDVNKSQWAAAVRSLNLPWTNVNDGLGEYSPAVSYYNLQGVPSMFVLDRSGNIVATNVYEKADLEVLLKKYL